jgi:hypothetical protein
VAVVLVIGIVLGSVANTVLAGESRLAGYVIDEPTAAGQTVVPRPMAVPDGWVPSGDPTWDFYVAAVAWNQLGAKPPRDACAICAAPAAGQDNQIPGPRLRAGAAERAVEHCDSAGIETPLRSLLDFDRQSARFDDDLARVSGLGDLRGDRIERFGGGQRSEDDGHALAERCDAARGNSACPFQRRTPRGDHIVAGHLEACPDQIGRYRRSHDAESDYADFVD